MVTLKKDRLFTWLLGMTMACGLVFGQAADVRADNMQVDSTLEESQPVNDMMDEMTSEPMDAEEAALQDEADQQSGYAEEPVSEENPAESTAE